MSVENEFLSMLTAAVVETGSSFATAKADVAAYMAERALHLSAIVHEPGFDQAVIAERNNVALRAGLSTAASADAADNHMIGLIGGALRIAAIALV